MTDLGAFLKEQRLQLHLSMNEVFHKTGITDSRLSRIERGESRSLNPNELKRLAELYNLNLVSLYIMADYLSNNDVKDYCIGFYGASLLTNEEHESIQTQIKLLTKGRTVNK